MKTLLISILALLTSCSSRAIVHEPYEVTKTAIDKYFSEKSDIYIGEGEKKKRSSFSTKYTEVVKGVANFGVYFFIMFFSLGKYSVIGKHLF